MPQFVTGLLVSFIAAMLLVRYSHLHERFSGDHDLDGVQKFHSRVVPRIGGLAIMLGVFACGLLPWGGELTGKTDCFLLLAVAAPAFLGGLHEDISKRGGIRPRLLCILFSSALAWWLADAQVVRLDLPLLDALVSWPPASLLFTMAAMTGMTNALNLIDGYNGLAGAVTVIMLAGIAWVGFVVGDHAVWPVALALIGATLGFLFWNWPRGLIFLGDGGAYLLGFMTAVLVVLLVARNPGVSPWFAALTVGYPMMEMGFTVYRRLVRKTHPGLPDAAHLHQLIYRRAMRRGVAESGSDPVLMRNSMTSPYLWALSALGVLPAVLFWDSTPVLQVAAVLYAGFYVWIYRSIVVFRFPRWLLASRPLK